MGLIGNTLTLFIAGDRKKRHPMMIRLLAVVDNLNIVVSIVDLIGYFLYGPASIYYLNNWGCKLGSYVLVTLQHYEAWVVVVLTLERYLSIMYPLKAHKSLSQRKLQVLLGAILFLNMIDYLPMLTSHSLVGSQYDYLCQANSKFGRWWAEKFYPTWQLVVFVGGPFGILLICNTAIIWQLIKRNRKRSELGISTSKKENTINLNKQAPLLLGVGFIFLITQAPMNIYLMTDIGNKAYSDDPVEQEYLDLGFNLVLTFSYINYSVNFFIYVLTNTAMRQKMISMFCSKCVSK